MIKKLAIYFLCVALVMGGTLHMQRESRAFVVLILPGIEVVMTGGGVQGLAFIAAGIGLTAWLLRFKNDSGGTAINARLNPKAPATVPAGWSAAGNPVDAPTPPATSPANGVTYGASSPNCAMAGAANGATPAEAAQNFMGLAGAACPATWTVCAVNGTTSFTFRNQFMVCDANALVGFFQEVQGGCPTGYTINAGVCTLTNAPVVRYPSDGQCELKLVSGTFTSDTRDPDCDGTPPSNYVVTESGKVITVTSGNEKSVLTSNPDNTIKVENWKGNGDGTSQYTAATFSPPDGASATGGTAVTGFSSAKVIGEGNLAGTTPSTTTDTASLAKDSTVAASNSKLDAIKAGQCGGVGQPQCNVKMDETGTPAAADFSKGGRDALNSKTPESFGVLPWSGGGVGTFPGLPGAAGSDSCVNPITWTWMGHTLNPDLCAIWGPLKPWFAWLIYAMTALYIWRRTTRALGGE